MSGTIRRKLILVVDDDPPIVRLIRAKLEPSGFNVISATNGREALNLLTERQPDAIVLDIMMPEMDGLETMRQIRETSNVPIILLSARSSSQHRIEGLDYGADDYVTKPFNPDELSARLSAVLRRAAVTSEPEDQVLEYDELTVDLVKRKITLNDEEVRLSRTEWELLYELACHAGRVMTHRDLLSSIWGPEFRDETYYLRTWISRLRAKLGDNNRETRLITTFPGIGYRLEPPPSVD